MLRRHIGRPAQAELDAPALARDVAPFLRVAIVEIDDGDALRSEALEDLALGVRDGVFGAEVFDVGAPRVRDQRDVGRGELREIRDLAGVVHAELDHGVAMGLAQLEQRERRADVVVQIAARGKHGAGLRARGQSQDCGEHLLHGRLAAAAGDRDERGGEARPPVRRQRAQ